MPNRSSAGCVRAGGAGLLDREVGRDRTVLNRDVRPPGITVHRTRALSREETQLLDGIPTTSPARTIVDLARELEPADLGHLLAQAYAKKRVTRAKVLAVVALRPTRSGVRTLRRLLEPDFRPSFTRSEAEWRFLALVREIEAPRAAGSTPASRATRSIFFWPQANLVVEVDGHAFHAAKPQRERTAPATRS